MNVQTSASLPRASSEYTAEQQGERWIAALADDFAKLPKGSVVIIKVDDGAYVYASGFIEAQQLFDQKFGKNQTIGWVHRIGESTFVGGGIA